MPPDDTATDTDHDAIFDQLADAAEDPDPTTLRFVLDDGRTLTGGVVDPQVDRDPDPDTVDLTLEFDEAVKVELPDDVDEDSGWSQTGFVRMRKVRGDVEPAEVRLTAASHEAEYPLVGEVASVERVDRD